MAISDVYREGAKEAIEGKTAEHVAYSLLGSFMALKELIDPQVLSVEDQIREAAKTFSPVLQHWKDTK